MVPPLPQDHSGCSSHAQPALLEASNTHVATGLHHPTRSERALQGSQLTTAESADPVPPGKFCWREGMVSFQEPLLQGRAGEGHWEGPAPCPMSRPQLTGTPWPRVPTLTCLL